MHKEHLFEKIRQEDVVLWAGAGISIYAGFPSGNDLSRIIFENLTKSEREIIGEIKPLDEIAEEYIRFRCGSKNELFKLLKKQFIYFKPKSNIWHKKLSHIPHIKTIITTNYDQMFERTFEELGQQICTTNQIPLIDKSKVEIFKIHGDLSYPETILISKSDYNDFFKKYNENNAMWNVVKERISTNCVLFLGYNLNDSNVNVVFERIMENFDTFKKECFFIAPSTMVAPQKILHLQRKGIHYIDLDAETFINELRKNIDENIIDDFENGRVSAKTFRDYTANLGLAPKIKSNQNQFKLESFDEPNGPVEKKINFNINSDYEYLNHFKDITSGKKIGEIEITSDKIKDLNLWIGPLKLPNSSNFDKLKLVTSPNIITEVDIRLDDGFEVSDVIAKIFVGNGITEIHAKFKVLDVIIKIDIHNFKNKADFKFKHNLKCGKISDELEWFYLFKKISSGVGFTIFPKNGNPIQEKLIKLPSALEDANFFISFFENLRKIEIYYKIQFTNIDFTCINGELYQKADKIVIAISREKQEQNWNGEFSTVMKLTKDEISNFKTLNGKESAILGIEDNKAEVIEFLGHKLELGFKIVEVMNLFINNIDGLRENKQQKVIFRSASQKVKVFYLKELEKQYKP